MNVFYQLARPFRWLKNQIVGRSSASQEEEDLLRWLGVDSYNPKAIGEVTYFTCLKLLSETMGKLPIKFYQQTSRGRIRAEPTSVSRALAIRPNPYMTPTTLWTTVEYNCQQYGNAYVVPNVKRTRSRFYTGNIVELWPLQSEYVTVYIDDEGWFGKQNGLFYVYSDPKTGKLYRFESDDILHFKTWYAPDGIIGYPVREILKATVDGALSAQTYLNDLYKNGLTSTLVLHYTSELDEKHREALKKKFEGSLMGGSQNAGKVIPVPMGLTLEPLKMSLSDAQFAELRKYTALQIAAAFGIKPDQLNNYDKSSSYKVDAQHLTFLVDTMAFRLKMYEEEINAKLLTLQEQYEDYFFKFHEKALLRADAETQMQTIASGVNNGIYTPNEAREYLDLPAEDGGDVLIVNGNYIPLTMVGTQYGGKEVSGNGND